MPPVGLLRAATERYKLDPIRDVRRLDGGHENELYRLESGDRTFVLRVEVAAAHPDSLRWEHSLAQFLAGSIPEVVGPLRAPDGSTFFVHEGRAATLLPYVDATPADRDRDWRAAAELLGALHAVSVTRSFPSRPGYPSLAERAWLAPSVAQVPSSIRARRNQIERELARCHAWITGRRLRTGAIHGDDAPSVNSERTDELLVPLIRCRLVVEVVREIRLNVPDAEWNYALHLLRSLVNVG